LKNDTILSYDLPWPIIR